MSPHIIATLLRGCLALSLLLSAAEMSRVGLFVAASFADTDCGNALCACSTSCSYGNDSHSPQSENAAGIPQLFDVSAPTEEGSCCPAKEEGAADSGKNDMHAHEEASVCSCGQVPGDEGSGLIKPLEKTVFQPATPLQVRPAFSFLKYAFHPDAHPAFPDEVFHPPKYC